MVKNYINIREINLFLILKTNLFKIYLKNYYKNINQIR